MSEYLIISLSMVDILLGSFAEKRLELLRVLAESGFIWRC